MFPENLKFKRKYLLEAYICLAARLLMMDKESYSEKLAFMSRHFRKHFPDDTYNFGDSLIYSFKHPIKEKTVTDWMDQKLPGDEYKMQVLYFLFGLSAIDGMIDSRELKFLQIHQRCVGNHTKKLRKHLRECTVNTSTKSLRTVQSTQ